MYAVGDRVKVKYIQNATVENKDGIQFDVTSLVDQSGTVVKLKGDGMLKQVHFDNETAQKLNDKVKYLFYPHELGKLN